MKQRTKSKEQRAKSKEQRAKSKEQRARLNIMRAFRHRAANISRGSCSIPLGTSLQYFQLESIKSTLCHHRKRSHRRPQYAVTRTFASSGSSAGGWTERREKRLRAVLVDEADILKEDFDLAKEIRVAVSWRSSRNLESELSELISQAEALVDSRSSGKDLLDSIIPYEPAIMALIQSARRDPERLVQADVMMKNMLRRIDDGTRPVPFCKLNDLFGHMVTAWAAVRFEKVENRGASNRRRIIVPSDAAEAWLRRWTERVLARNENLNNGDPTIKDILVADAPMLGPGPLVFGAAIDAHAKSKSKDSAERAERLLDWLLELGSRYVSNIDVSGKKSETQVWTPPRPNSVMYTSVIDAWSRSAHHVADAANRAEKWLKTMEDSYFDDEVVEAKPSILAYSAVIMSHSRSRHTRQQREECNNLGSNPAERAEDVLLRLLRRNQMQIERGPDDGDKPLSFIDLDVNVINGIIDAWTRQVGRDKDPFATALCAERWLALLLGASRSNEGDEKSTGAASQIFQSHRQDLSSDNELFRSLPLLFAAADIAPDVVTYNSVINALSRCPKSTVAAERAERCLDAMKEQGISPTSITYGAITKAWGNTSSSAGAVHATKHLEKYERLAREGLIEPHKIVYNNVLDAWANSGRDDALKKMRIVLARMEECWEDDTGEDEGVALVPPGMDTYNIYLKAITAWAEKEPNEAFGAYLGVLDALTGEDERLVAEMPAFVSTILCASQCVKSPEDRADPRYIELCRTIFERCRNHGLVNKAVLGTLKAALPPEPALFEDILGTNKGQVPEEGKNIIPREWRRSLPSQVRGRGRTHGSPTALNAFHSRKKRLISRKHMRR